MCVCVHVYACVSVCARVRVCAFEWKNNFNWRATLKLLGATKYFVLPARGQPLDLKFCKPCLDNHRVGKIHRLTTLVDLWLVTAISIQTYTGGTLVCAPKHLCYFIKQNLS